MRESEHTFNMSGLTTSVPEALVIFNESKAAATSEVSIVILLIWTVGDGS